MSVIHKIARSSITGRFVPWLYARLHPKTTVIETVEVPDPEPSPDEQPQDGEQQ